MVMVAAPAAVADGEWARRVAGPVRRVWRLLFSVVLTFLGLTCVTFFIGRVIPIDPVLAIVGDKVAEPTETFTVHLVGVTSGPGQIGNGVGTGTILDND